MKRIGRFTGKIYDEKEVLRINECCDVISDAQANNSEWVKERHKEYMVKCSKCMSCIEAKKMKGVG